MTLLEDTLTYRAETEGEAAAIVESYKAQASEKGYIIKSSKVDYKVKKAKGEIIGEAWVVKVTMSFGGVWDEL